MTQDNGDGAARKDLVISRPFRRRVTGVAYTAQKSRLIPDRPDAEGNDSYPCKIADVSVDGFGVVCRAASINPTLFETGSEMTLEGSDGKRVRVQIRWAKKDRLGLKVLRPTPR